MRYTNGGPKKLYVVVDQYTGEVYAFTSTKQYNKVAGFPNKDKFKKITYVQQEGGK